LEVLTPDLMEIIQDRASDKIDVEIEGKSFYLMCGADSYTGQNMSALFELAEELLAKLDHLSKTWMAANKNGEKVIAKAAEENHARLIFKIDYVSLVTGLVIMLTGLALMASNIYETSNQPPSMTAPVYTKMP